MNRVKEYKQARHLNVYNVGACFHSILINTNVNLFTDSLLQANSHSYILYIKSNIPHDMPPRIYTHTHTHSSSNYTTFYYTTVQRLRISRNFKHRSTKNWSKRYLYSHSANHRFRSSCLIFPRTNNRITSQRSPIIRLLNLCKKLYSQKISFF